MPNIGCGDKELDRDALFFDYVLRGNQIDLTLFVPGIAAASTEEIVGLKAIGYLFLEAVAGEYDFETKITGIEFVDASAFQVSGTAQNAFARVG
ncbi:MAG TPA: hypothetical protein VIX37_01480 [Candidatus Sulfotelmatobacter sp.]